MQHEYDAANLGIASAKIPPSWSPERDKIYPLRTWIQDTRLWSVGTDVEEAKQGPVCAMRVGGSAKALIRELDVNVLSNGGIFPDAQGQPQQLTGLECLIRALQRRYGPLEQELEIHVIAEMLNFARGQNEDTDSVVNRFGLIKQRAFDGAGFNMSWIGYAFLLLTALGIHKASWPLLLAPTQGALPRTQQEFDAFTQYVRRQGHLTDKNVDTVKNMQYFSTPSHEPVQQQNTFMTLNTWTEQAPAFPSFDAPVSYSAPVFAGFEEASVDEADDGLSSCNSGDSVPDLSDVQALPEQVAGEQLYLAYQHAKKRWRHFTGGRKRLHFRRFRKHGSMKGRKGSGKGFKGGKSQGFQFGGKGKGKGRMYYLDEYTGAFHQIVETDPAQTYAYVPDTSNPSSTSFSNPWNEPSMPDDEQVVYLAGKPGKFRRKNPRGKDGKMLLCSLCNSDEHLIKKCPKNTAGLNFTQHQQQHGKSFLSSASTSSSSNSSAVQWSLPMYFGTEHVQESSTCSIECEGTVLRLEPILEQPQARHYYMPAESQLEKKSELAVEEAPARNFMFAWFESLFHANVRCKDFEGLLIDIGAWGNLCGERWFQRILNKAQKFGQGYVLQKMKQMLSIEGVGQSANTTQDEVVAPVCLEDGSVCTYTAPMLADSELPALLGLKSLSEKHALIDTFNKRLIFVGPGGYRLQLSPGSKTFPLHSAATGHLMLQCDSWETAKFAPTKKEVAFANL